MKPAEQESLAAGAESAEPIDLPQPADPPEVVEPQDPHCCPRCGSKDYRRSRRRAFERFIGRPPMARCRACRYRFPFPQF